MGHTSNESNIYLLCATQPQGPMVFYIEKHMDDMRLTPVAFCGRIILSWRSSYKSFVCLFFTFHGSFFFIFSNPLVVVDYELKDPLQDPTKLALYFSVLLHMCLTCLNITCVGHEEQSCGQIIHLKQEMWLQ